MASEVIQVLSVLGIFGSIVVFIVSLAIYAADREGPIEWIASWLKRHVGHVHDGPMFKVTATYGGTISGSCPQKVYAWHTCKKDDMTYAVERFETADEFDTRIAAEAPKS